MGVELTTQLMKVLADLDDAIDGLKRYGEVRAVTERDYKKALSMKSLAMKDAGMAVTLIDKTVYGYVADERFARDMADVQYQAAYEQINVLKLKARLLDAQIGREWGR